jgi:hypothetical protein
MLTRPYRTKLHHFISSDAMVAWNKKQHNLWALYLRWQQLWVASYCYHRRCLVMDELITLITSWIIGWSPSSNFYAIFNLSFLIQWFTCFTGTILWKIKSRTSFLLLSRPITSVKPLMVDLLHKLLILAHISGQYSCQTMTGANH